MLSPYQDLLTALANHAGLEAPALLASEEIVVNDLPIGLQLSGEGEQAAMVLCSLLGPVPADRWPEVSRHLLLANHLWAGTGGATLGVMDDDNTVSLSLRRSLHELDVNQLSQLLVSFAEIGLTWQEFISQAHSSSFAPAWPEAVSGMFA